MVTIASVRPICPKVGKTEAKQKDLQRIFQLVERAAKNGADLICLPEDFLTQQINAEPLDGPLCTAISEKARKHKVNIVAGIIEQDHDLKYNSTVVFDRNGAFLGSYHKTHLTKIEKEVFGLTPGQEISVLQLDIGIISIITCADMLFPEVARCAVLKGAQLIVFPHQQAEPSLDFERIMVRSRAQDNCVPIVCSTFAATPDWKCFPNWIVDARGRIIEEGPEGEGVAMAELDLGVKVAIFDYIEAGKVDLSDIIRRYRRPELYTAICKAK